MAHVSFPPIASRNKKFTQKHVIPPRATSGGGASVMEGINHTSPSSGDLPSFASSSRPVKIIQLQHPNTASTSAPSSDFIGKWKAKMKRMSSTEWIELFLPCYRWIRTYKWREYLQPDLMAGITVGVMLVPQVWYRRIV